MPASSEQLIGHIRRIFADKLAIEVDSPAVDLLDTGLVDSVSLVELLLELEHQFGLSLPLEELEMEDFRSIGRIADLVVRTRTRGSSPAVPAALLGNSMVDAPGPTSGAAA